MKNILFVLVMVSTNAHAHDAFQEAVLEACDNFYNRDKGEAADFKEAVLEAVKFW